MRIIAVRLTPASVLSYWGKSVSTMILPSPMRSSMRKPEGSSMEVNTKFRSTISKGVGASEGQPWPTDEA